MPPIKDRLPCVCGNKLLQMWSGYGNCTIKCAKCGLEVYGKTKNEVAVNWNKRIREEREKHEPEKV